MTIEEGGDKVISSNLGWGRTWEGAQLNMTSLLHKFKRQRWTLRHNNSSSVVSSAWPCFVPNTMSRRKDKDHSIEWDGPPSQYNQAVNHWWCLNKQKRPPFHRCWGLIRVLRTFFWALSNRRRTKILDVKVKMIAMEYRAQNCWTPST